MTVLFFLVLFAFLSLLSFPISFVILFILFSFFIMSFEPKQKKQRISPIIEAKSLLSKENKAGAFDVLKKGAKNGNVMAYFDCGFMMIQGIGCEKDWEGGLEFISNGVELKKQSSDMSWNSDGSVSELFEPQSMSLNSLFSLMNMI